MERIVYNWEKVCKRCGRSLPYTYQYFPYDKNYKYKLRNTCRECDPKYKNFLSVDYVPSAKWTPEDLSILKENYPNYTNEELHKKFFPNRSIRGIESTASKYGFGHKTPKTLKRSLKQGAAKNPECQKGRVISDEWRKHMSEAQTKRYQDPEQREISRQIAIRNGYFQLENHPIHKNPLYGEANGRWKGGCSESVNQFRRDILEWKKESIRFCDYKCVITGEQFKDIHHPISFNAILCKALKNVGLDLKPQISDYSNSEYSKIKSELIRIHKIIPYGACLNSKIHTLFHKEFSYYDFTINDFVSFYTKICNGDYAQFFNENDLNLSLNEEYFAYLKKYLKKGATEIA